MTGIKTVFLHQQAESQTAVKLGISPHGVQRDLKRSDKKGCCQARYNCTDTIFALYALFTCMSAHFKLLHPFPQQNIKK